MKAADLVLPLAILLSACATGEPPREVAGLMSSENFADCDERARRLTSFGVAESPLTNQPWSGASQWVQAPGTAAFNLRLRETQYRRCLEEKAAGTAGSRAR